MKQGGDTCDLRNERLGTPRSNITSLRLVSFLSSRRSGRSSIGRNDAVGMKQLMAKSIFAMI